MPAPTISPTQKIKLRGAYNGRTYLSVQPIEIECQATITSVPTTGGIYQVSVNTPTTGAVANCLEGYTLFVTDTGVTDLHEAKFTGYVRKDASGTIIPINWVDNNEPIEVGDVVTVIRDVRVWFVQDRITSGGTHFKGYDRAFTRLPAIPTDLRTVYIGFVDSGTSKYTATLDGSASSWANGTTVSGHQWTLPTGVTTSDSLTGASITIEADPGYYIVKKVTTNSAGVSYTRYCYIFAHDRGSGATFEPGVSFASEDRPVAVNIDGAVDEGWNATVTAFDGVNTILDNSLVVVWQEQYFNGETTPDTTFDNVRFVGRIRSENAITNVDERFGLLGEVAYEIAGAGARLAELFNYAIWVKDNASPANWLQMAQPTPYRLAAFILAWNSTYLLTHALNADAIDSTYRAWRIDSEAGMILDTIADLLERVNARMEFDPDGGLFMARSGYILSSSDKASLPDVMDYEQQDMSGWSVERSQINRFSQVQAFGYYYRRPGNQGTSVLAGVAPGSQRGSGAELLELRGQALTAGATKANAQSELNTRVGREFAEQNTEHTITVQLPDNYTYLIPSLYRRNTFTISSSANPNGRGYTTDTHWYNDSVNMAFDIVNGLVDINARFRIETAGRAGIAQEFKSPTPTDPGLISLPPIVFPTLGTDFGTWDFLDTVDPENVLPPPTIDDGDAATDGSTVVAWSASQVWIGTLYNTTNPQWQEITPPGYSSVTDCKWDWFKERLFVLAGTNAAWSDTSDFPTSPDNWQSRDPVTASATYGGTKWEDADYLVPTSQFLTGGTYRRIVDIIIFLDGDTDVTDIEFDYELTKGSFANPAATTGIAILDASAATAANRYDDNIVVLNSSTAAALATGPGTFSWSGNENLTAIRLLINSSVQNSASYSGDCAITEVRVNGTGYRPTELGGPSGGLRVLATEDPFSGSPTYSEGDQIEFSGVQGLRLGTTLDELYVIGNNTARYSDDAGATWGTATTIGTATADGDIGFDTSKVGAEVILAGAEDQVRVSTDDAATWGDETNGAISGEDPVMIWIPARQFGGSTLNTGTSPQYLLAPRAAVAGNRLYKVDGGGQTAINPAIGVIVGPNGGAMNYHSGSKIVVLTTDTVNERLYVSTDASTFTAAATVDTASYVRMRRGDSQAKQIYIAGESGALWFSNDFGTNVYTRTAPSDDDMLGIEPYG